LNRSDETPRTHTIAALAGDGIGLEVVPAALEVLDAAAGRYDFRLDVTEHPWGCSHYLRHGEMMPADGLDAMAESDAILLGAVGDPQVPDHISLWGLLIPIRRAFDQYVNLRPVRAWPGVGSPLRDVDAAQLETIIVRENAEGEYSDVGGRARTGSGDEVAVQVATFSRSGVERTVEYAFALAGSRGTQLTSATKSNGILHTMPFWDECVEAVAERYPDVDHRSLLIDALAARVVQRPGEFDVIVASNLFGDILSDLVAALAGGLGLAPSANLNPERAHPSMFEPVHGSAPDIAGRGIANPIACISSGAMMLEHLGEADAAAAMWDALELVLAEDGPRTPDLGGSATTQEIAGAVAAALG
jgi:tartrate dehydrogenase/decarboxylase/D-malate dehydrogenase